MFVFMLIMALLIPIFLIVIGLVWKKRPPKNINSFYGYRTNRSMKSQESWNYAHLLCAKIFLIIGCIEIIPTTVLIFVFKDSFYYICIIELIAQCVLLFFPIVIVERQLKKNFSYKGI